MNRYKLRYNPDQGVDKINVHDVDVIVCMTDIYLQWHINDTQNDTINVILLSLQRQSHIFTCALHALAHKHRESSLLCFPESFWEL